MIVAVGSKAVNSVGDVEEGVAAAQDGGRNAVLFRVRARTAPASSACPSTRLTPAERTSRTIVAPIRPPRQAGRASGPPCRLGGELAERREADYLNAMRILVIEDDREPAGYLVKALREAGHVADSAHRRRGGLEHGDGGGYDVLVVDRMLPKRDGLSLIAELRGAASHVPVLILSALGQVDDRVTGLRAGGDDYLPKPYAFSELLARVEVLGRRSAPRRRRPSIGSATSSSTAWRARSPRRRADHRCSRASSACSNT